MKKIVEMQPRAPEIVCTLNKLIPITGRETHGQETWQVRQINTRWYFTHTDTYGI